MSDSLNFARVVDQNKVFYTLIATCCVRELIIVKVSRGSLMNSFFSNDHAFLKDTQTSGTKFKISILIRSDDARNNA